MLLLYFALTQGGGVCIRERERERERGRREKEKRMGELDGACVGDKKTEQIKSDFGLK